MRTCTVYRTTAKTSAAAPERVNYNDPHEPQFEACVFSDGTVAQRWLTTHRSMSVWPSWDELRSVHITAHPDYGTRVVWTDGEIEEL